MSAIYDLLESLRAEVAELRDVNAELRSRLKLMGPTAGDATTEDEW